jgi:ABC-type transport system involved in cytochrome bd biosynthesis fused ATPase/permease subunit
MALLYGRTGRLTATNGGFRPGQGAGKSSMTIAMLRLADEIGGELLIDGVDHQSVSHAELRAKLAIIPQEATMFAGTLRLNLDPLAQCTAGLALSQQCSLARSDLAVITAKSPVRTSNLLGLPGDSKRLN